MDEVKGNYVAFHQVFSVPVPMTPTSAKQSRQISTALTAFIKAARAEDELRMDMDALGTFLLEQAHALLADKYALSMSKEEFEDRVSFAEVASFWLAQVEVNGPQDFLIRPMGAMVKSMIDASANLDTVLADAFEQLMARPLNS